jgi:ankyrin repeat protein
MFYCEVMIILLVHSLFYFLQQIGHIALLEASRFGKILMVKLLIDKGADVNKQSKVTLH